MNKRETQTIDIQPKKVIQVKKEKSAQLLELLLSTPDKKYRKS